MKKRVALIGLALLIGVKLTIIEPTAASNTTKPAGCREPHEARAGWCRALERQILNSTVLISFKGWVIKPGGAGYQADYSSGHGTVMDGRYLVTHNHFSLPVSDERGEGGEVYGVRIYLYDSAGLPVFQGPSSEFEVVVEEGETLVLRHEDEGFFKALGFSSAEFGAWASLPVEIGVEVAQVDWDGLTTRVDWVKVKDVDMEAGTPRLVLADGVFPGASGGGIFWEGVHVANNWLYQAKVGEGGDRYDEATTAALNPQAVIYLVKAGPKED